MDENPGKGRYSYRLKQVDYKGTFSYSEIHTIEIGKPTEFKVYETYPHPFNGTTIISYQLPNRANVEVSVYNAVGEHIRELVSAEQESGYYRVVFDASSLLSGVYFYRIIARTRIVTYSDRGKMLYVK